VPEPSREWLEVMLKACEAAAARLQPSRDPAHEPLLEDIRALQTRLLDELDERDR
jgi:hypothetical protein